MTSYQITQDLPVRNEGPSTEADVYSDSDDSDISSEEDCSPEPEESIQGPLTRFSRRGPQKADCAAAPKKDDKTSKKDQKDGSLPQIARPRKTSKPPPKSNAANYPAGK